MSTPSSSVGVDVIDNIDEFAVPGATDILSSATSAPAKRSIFSRELPADLSYLDDKSSETPAAGASPEPTGEQPADSEVAKVKASPEASVDTNDLFNALDGEEDSPAATTPTTSKKGPRTLSDVNVIQELIEKGRIIPFDDDKPLNEYTKADLVELLTANFDDLEKKYRQEIPQQFFDALPAEMQKAAQYLMDGGTDLKSMFKALSHVQEVRELDVTKESDQIQIVRQYMQATDWGTDEEIEDEINSYKDLGTLNKRASSMKPKLDKMQEEIVDHQIRQQEETRKIQEEARQSFVQNIYKALAPGNLNGITIDRRTQDYLYTELTNARYKGMNGRPTNLLGHLLEKHQYVEPRFDLIAEATLLLADPEAYKERIRSQARQQTTTETVRTLKTEQGRKLATGTSQTLEEEPKPAKRTIARTSRNIFERA